MFAAQMAQQMANSYYSSKASETQDRKITKNDVNWRNWNLDTMRKELKLTSDYNKKVSDDNRRWIEDYYNRYESPEAKARLYKEAGFNPYAAVGSEGSMPLQSVGSMPTTDPSSGLSFLASEDNSLTQERLTNQQLRQQRFLQSFEIAAQMAQTYGSLQNIEQDVRAKKIQNDREEFINTVWSQPISDDWKGLIPGMDSLFSSYALSGPSLEPNNYSGLTFGQALQMAQAFETLKNLNEKGGGFYSNDPQTPWSHYVRSVAREMSKHGRDWHDIDLRDFSGEAYAPWRSAFDVVHGSNLSGISQSEYQRWYNDWQKDLRKKGLNPEGNDLLSTALRIVHSTTPKDDFDYMMGSLGKGLGIAASGVGDIFNLLDGLDRLIKPSEAYKRSREKFIKSYRNR